MSFVQEMRSVTMRLHTREQSKEAEKHAAAPEETSPATWEPTIDGHLRFLVDSCLVYMTLEKIVVKAPLPCYEFRHTGLERTGRLTKDLEWLKEQGHAIPRAFICHFYVQHLLWPHRWWPYNW